MPCFSMNRRTVLGLSCGAIGSVVGGARLYAAVNSSPTGTDYDPTTASPTSRHTSLEPTRTTVSTESSPTPSDTVSEETEDETSTTPQFETRNGDLLLGVSPQTVDRNWLSVLERWQGQQNASVGVFVNVGISRDQLLTVANRLLTPIWEHGSVPHVIWQPYMGSRKDTSPTVARDIATGRHDQTLERWAEILEQWLRPADTPDRRLYLNFAPEMNGDWLPWDTSDGETTPSDYVAMWRRVHDIIERTGVDGNHLQWIWAMNRTGRTTSPIEAFYPGDKYVDWCGVHGYNWSNWGGWMSPERLYEKPLNAIESFTDNPTVLSEYGSSSDVDDGHDPAKKDAWIRDTFEYVAERNVRMALWFNHEKETDWAVFGGSRGTETFEHAGRTYKAYEEYRRGVNDEGVLPAYPGHPRRLTDEEFHGEF